MRIAVRYSVRAMTVDDIPQVIEIERESFPSMWPPTAFKRELQQNRLARYILIVEHNPGAGAPAFEPEEETRQGGALGRIMGELKHLLGSEEAPELPPPNERPELVSGFLGLWMMPDEAHIVTIATRESHRRRGIGERLLIEAIEMAQDGDQPLITLECRVNNVAALALYKKYGFEQAGLRPRYYSDNQEDAYILTAGSVLSRNYRALLEGLKQEHSRRWGDFETPRAGA